MFIGPLPWFVPSSVTIVALLAGSDGPIVTFAEPEVPIEAGHEAYSFNTPNS